MREAVRTGEIGEGRAVGAEGWRNDDIMPELWTAWFLATEDGEHSLGCQGYYMC